MARAIQESLSRSANRRLPTSSFERSFNRRPRVAASPVGALASSPIAAAPGGIFESRSSRLLAFLLLAFLVPMLGGCFVCPTTKLNLSVQLDDSLRQTLQAQGKTAVLVDIVAISPTERQRWTNYSMTQYWSAGDTLRTSAPVFPLTFDPSKAQAQTLAASDPIWQKWLQGANDKDGPRIFILAQLPGNWDPAKDDKPGNQDPRRLILPLGACRWDGKTNVPVTVTVTATGMTTVPSPKEDKPGS